MCVATGLAHHDVLVPYVAWMAVAAGASVVAARATVMVTAAMGAGVLAGLVLVWRWVLRCERAKPDVTS